jgi:hypothetical protein
MAEPTPIFDAVMDHFYTERIDFVIDELEYFAIRVLAACDKIPLEMLLQDIVEDHARKVLIQHGLRRL